MHSTLDCTRHVLDENRFCGIMTDAPRAPQKDHGRVNSFCHDHGIVSSAAHHAMRLASSVANRLINLPNEK
jgi:hypothetical protein